jgi:hypothetical protein
MPHEALIHRLAADLRPVRRRRAGVELALIGGLCGLELLLFFLCGMARPDMPMMMQQAAFWWRLASLGLIAGVSGAQAVLSFGPTHRARRALPLLAILVLLCLVAGAGMEMRGQDFADLLGRLQWRNGLRCVVQMVVLALPPVLGLGLFMKRGAATDGRASALLAGLAAASWGAFVFVFACPSDDPLYIILWYGIGCGIVTALARALLPRIARW